MPRNYLQDAFAASRSTFCDDPNIKPLLHDEKKRKKNATLDTSEAQRTVTNEVKIWE
jgi:hypothetical protein